MHGLAKLADQERTTKAARTRQTGKKGTRKKAEINESEPSGNELGNVDDLEVHSSQVLPLGHVCGACS